jgi:hypothetical protein
LKHQNHKETQKDVEDSPEYPVTEVSTLEMEDALGHRQMCEDTLKCHMMARWRMMVLEDNKGASKPSGPSLQPEYQLRKSPHWRWKMHWDMACIK